MGHQGAGKIASAKGAQTRPAARVWTGLMLCTALSLGFVAPLGLARAQIAPETSTDQSVLPATLIADRIDFSDGTSRIEASGNVEIFHQGAHLRASRVIYDAIAGQITVEGPLSLSYGGGETVILADMAQMSSDMREGLIRSARIVMARQFQIATTRIDRSQGRYTQMYQSVASSCEICTENATPLWEIRAARVIHDQEARRVYFENAQFRIAGLPVAYLPRLRIPDPSVSRARGFLPPSITRSTLRGVALRVPYFLPFGDHADLTLAPVIGSGDSKSLEARYRQAFAQGDLELTGALTNDDTQVSGLRGYLFGEARFDLPRDFDLALTLQTVSDRAYLAAYDYSGVTELQNRATLSRIGRAQYIRLDFLRLSSLSDQRNTLTYPNRRVELDIRQHFDAAGGLGEVTLLGQSDIRSYDAANPNRRDMQRLSLQADWMRDVILPGGLVLGFGGAVAGDYFAVADDARFPDSEQRASAIGVIDLSWPFAMTTAQGVTHVFEPQVQFVSADIGFADIPNEDSQIIEFDEGNLFGLSRYAGVDRREDGQRVNLGATYRRISAGGTSLSLTLGRVLRVDEAATGFESGNSDYLLAFGLQTASGLTLNNRSLFDRNGDLRLNELTLAATRHGADLRLRASEISADAAQGRPRDVTELSAAFGYQITTSLHADFEIGYDVENDLTRRSLFVVEHEAANGLGTRFTHAYTRAETRRTALDLTYRTECIVASLGVARRFSALSNLPTAREIVFGVDFIGLSGSGGSDRANRRQCRG